MGFTGTDCQIKHTIWSSVILLLSCWHTNDVLWPKTDQTTRSLLQSFIVSHLSFLLYTRHVWLFYCNCVLHKYYTGSVHNRWKSEVPLTQRASQQADWGQLNHAQAPAPGHTALLHVCCGLTLFTVCWDTHELSGTRASLFCWTFLVFWILLLHSDLLHSVKWKQDTKAVRDQ